MTGNAGKVGCVVVSRADVSRSAADLPLLEKIVGCPQGRAVSRHVQQFVSFDLGIGRLAKLGIEEGISGEHIQIRKDPAGNADFETLHPLLSIKHSLTGSAIRIVYTRVGLVNPEYGALQAQGAVEKLQLGADFESFVLFRIGLRVIGRQLYRFSGGVERRRVRKIVALRWRRMKNEAAAIAPHFIRAIEITPGSYIRIADRRIVEIRVEVVPPDPADEIEIFVQPDLIRGEYAEPEGFAVRKSRYTLDHARRALVRIWVVDAGRRHGSCFKRIVGPVQRLSGKLDSCHKSVLQAKRVELAREIRLIAQNLLNDIALRPVSVEKVGKRGGIEARRRDLVLAVVVTVAQGVAQAEHIVEAVIEPRGSDIEQRPLVVLAREPVEIISIHAGRVLVIKVRYAVVRNIVFALDEVTQSELGRRAEAERDRWRKTEALLLRYVAADEFVLVAHQVDPESDRRGYRLVDISGASQINAVTQTQSAAITRGELRNLADLIDRAARGAAAKILRRRSL